MMKFCLSVQEKSRPSCLLGLVKNNWILRNPSHFQKWRSPFAYLSVNKKGVPVSSSKKSATSVSVNVVMKA